MISWHWGPKIAVCDIYVPQIDGICPDGRRIPLEVLRMQDLTTLEENELLLYEDESNEKDPMKIRLSRGKRRSGTIREALAQGGKILSKKERQQEWEE